MHPLAPERRRIERYFSANAFPTELDSAGRVMVPPRLHGARRPREGRRGHRRRRLPRALGPRRLGGLRRPTLTTSRLSSPLPLAILLDMTPAHVPVLAGGADRRCWTRSRARSPSTARSARAATRAWSPSASAPTGTLIAIDRDPAAEERFDELAAEVAVRHALHARRRSPTASQQLADEGVARRPRLPRPRHVLDAGRHARARLLLRLRRAAGHAHGPRAGADGRRDRQHVGGAPPVARCCATTARSASPPDRPRDRARAAAAPS